MNRFARAVLASVALAVLGAIPFGDAAAQPNYPTKPIRLIVPVATGGAVDAVARIVGQRLAERLGQPVVVDNRPGANGMIGADAVAKSAPDGYTLLYTSAGITAQAALYKNVPYDVLKDFVPVSQTASMPLIIVGHPSLPATNFRELVAYSKSRPGTLNIASTTAAMQLSIENLKRVTGADLTLISYKGSAPALTDFLGGHIQILFDTAFAMMPHVKSAKVKAVAVTSGKRAALAPDVPTVTEAGFGEYESTSWQAVLAPAGTPAAVTRRLSSEIMQILKEPEVRARLASVATEPVGSSQEDLAAVLRRETAFYLRMARELGITPE